MATVYTYRFIKESNGNVIIQWLRNGQPFQRFSVQPAKDIRMSLTANGQVIIPIDNNGGIDGQDIISVSFQRIDFLNSVPSSPNPASPNEAVQRLGEDFFYESVCSGGSSSVTLDGDVTGTGTCTIATTISDDAVTFAKIQNIDQDHLIGRHATGTGDPQQIGLDGGVEFHGGKLRAKVSNSVVLSGRNIELSGDSESPGNSKYYGTNSSGVKGFYDLAGERRHDFTAPYSYMAYAQKGSADSAAVWVITQINVAADGTTTKGTATGAWTNRYSLIYT